MKSVSVKRYLGHIRAGAKIETALRESFFAGQSILSKILGDLIPEVRIEKGFIDYSLTINGRRILIEIKPFLKKDLSTNNIDIKDHKGQICKYAQEYAVLGFDYIILTNLLDWKIFNKNITVRNFEPFAELDFQSFFKELNKIKGIWDFLQRLEYKSVKLELDKQFFQSLKNWTSQLSKVEFKKSDIDKTSLIISLINKFIFVQTLDDFFIIDGKWIINTWNFIERRWSAKGQEIIIFKFLKEIDEWFYSFYDTELFKLDIIKYIKLDDKNIQKFYTALKNIIGLNYWQEIFNYTKGIIQYNFTMINEDIFGRAYETFLVTVRNQEGIYYTRRYITSYMIESTLNSIFSPLEYEFGNSITNSDYKSAENIANQIIDIKILDPACGSGSFLIKAIKYLYHIYKNLKEVIHQAEKKFKAKSKISEYSKLEVFTNLKRILGINKSEKDMLILIVLRHIFGNDLDLHAINIAKINIWLELIKLSSKDFHYSKLSKATNYNLPNLEMNLVSGNSLIGFNKNNEILKILPKFEPKFKEISKLRKEYIQKSLSPEIIEKIKEIKTEIIKNTDKFFEDTLKDDLQKEIKKKAKIYAKKELSEEDWSIESKKEEEITIQFDNIIKRLIENSFHWPIEFWFTYFDIHGKPLSYNNSGFDVVVGNPPYVDYRSIVPLELNFYLKKYFKSCSKPKNKYNLYVPFIEKGLVLLKKNGFLTYINPIHYLSIDMAKELRKFIFEKYCLHSIVDLSYVKVFEDVSTYVVISQIQNKIPDKKFEIQVSYKTKESDILNYLKTLNVDI